MKHDRTIIALLLTILMSILLPLTAAHADRDRGHDKHREHDREVRRDHRDHDRYFDRRFQHNHFYPHRGVFVDRIPVHHFHVRFDNDDYFLSGGVWYHSFAGRYRVVAPPIGLVVSTLPDFYTTIWIGGIPYYYANDVYYVWNADDNGYVVTNKPASAKDTTATTTPEELYIYPMKGQSKQKQADDRYACHQWSVGQTNYDPSQPPTNLSPAEMSNERASYDRAMKACLKGRGYSVD